MHDNVLQRFLRKVNFRLYYFYLPHLNKKYFIQDELRQEGFQSQSGQDKWLIERIFPNKTDGIFVDIGAYDGVTFSNTFFLEKIGWNGLAVEPIATQYEKLKTNRRCYTIQGCVAKENGKKLFREIMGSPQMLSGMVETYHPLHLQRIEREMKMKGGEMNTIEVNSYRFIDLMEQYKIYHIDYLSIDVEGAEFQILRDIDFSRIDIKVIGVENNYQDYRIPRWLFKKGYIFDSLVGDEFYILDN